MLYLVPKSMFSFAILGGSCVFDVKYIGFFMKVWACCSWG